MEPAAFGQHVVDLWVRDVTSTQLARFAAGYAPVRAVANVSQRAANVILLPLQEHRRHGRLLFGLRRGAAELARTLVVETAQVSAALSRLVLTGLHALADGTAPPGTPPSAGYGPGGRGGGGGGGSGGGGSGFEVGAWDPTVGQRGDKPLGPPAGLRAGLGQAGHALVRGVGIAAHAIIAVPVGDFQRDGTKAGLRSAVRAVPVALLAPVIGATEAVSYTLLGLRNSMDPNRRHDDEAKYRARSK